MSLENAKGDRPWMMGNGIVIAAVQFSTNGSGVPTLKWSYNGLVTIVQATNLYTITLPGKWGKTYAVDRYQSLASTVTVTVTDTPTAGTVALQFSGAFNSAEAGFVLYGSHSVEG